MRGEELKTVNRALFKSFSETITEKLNNICRMK